MSWTEERVLLLKKLWADGVDASSIAAELGPGVTRNSVIGKIHRLGLAERATGRRLQPVPRTPPRKPVEAARNADAFFEQQKSPKEKMGRQLPVREEQIVPLALSPPVIEEVIIPESGRVTLLELKFNHCRWPMGDPQSPRFHFCGGKRLDPYSDSNPYCAYHARVAYVPRGAPRKKFSDETRAKMHAAHVKRGSTAWGNG